MKKQLLIIVIAFFASQVVFSQITDIQVVSNASSYINHNWHANSSNIWNDVNCGGKTVNTPFWVNVGSHTALPYCWGGNSTLSDFDYYLTQNKSAGDDNTASGYGAEPNCSIGVDCSGFVSRCYGLSTHYSTTMLNSNSLFGHYESYNDLQVGDFINKPGSHTRLVTQINNNGSITVLESGSGISNVGGNGLWKVFQWTYTISQLSQYNPQYYTNMTNGGNPPNNDNCYDAIALQSNENCNNTGGTVDGATYDNLNQPTCDNLSNTIKGVWYDFIASNSTHTIKVTPNNDMNAVVVIYSGSCSNLSEIDCNGAVSGGSGDIVSITNNSFNSGQTYRVWVYDYGNIDPANGDFDICITHSGSSGQPDIIVQNENVNPTTIQAGNTMSVSCRIRNNSSYDATDSGRVGYYLSTNTTFDNSDDLLDYSSFGTLDANDYSDENDSFTIPSNTPASTYYILFFADYQENIAESNENNNVEYQQIIVTNNGLPDIIVQNENVNPTTIQAGNIMSVSCRIRNNSSYDATDSGRVGYYLSTNTTFDNSDDFLDYSSFGTLDANDYSDENDSFTIPSNTPAGIYYILFFADYQENIAESNENNNVEYQQITVTNSTNLTYIHDDNFEQRLISLGYDDVLDNYVNTNNIVNVTYLYVTNENISDLTGIQDFSSLQTLMCENNQLTSIDISQNSNLENLWISFNQLTSLYLSQNSNLIQLGCTGNNIFSLDCSNNSNLEWLECASNLLTMLDVKNGNNVILTGFLANTNPNLSCILVDDEVNANNGFGVYASWVVDDGVNFSENCTLGISDEFLMNNITIFPNPTTGMVYINNPLKIRINKIVVSNLLGLELFINSNTDFIDLSKYDNGIYFISLFDNERRKASIKIIKK